MRGDLNHSQTCELLNLGDVDECSEEGFEIPVTTLPINPVLVLRPADVFV